ncbi:MAG TPA: hypothetical protein VFQ80_06950, partial [Thermomicrobiales bacterium]|nr:hypothetical protein [Thermomicrobiales bacterium]
MANLALDSPPTTSASTAPSSRARLTGATMPLVAAMATAALLARRWREMGPFPTGLDGGQWLALGRGLLGGVGRSTQGVYAPLVPVLSALAAGAVGPALGLRLVAMLAYAAVLVAIAALARLELDWAPTIVALLVVGSASAVVEPLAYGGYPQTLAFAAMLAGCAALSAALSRNANSVAWAALAFAVAAASHHIYGPIALACGGAVWTLWALDPASRGQRRAGLRRAVVALAPGAAIAFALLFA